VKKRVSFQDASINITCDNDVNKDKSNVTSFKVNDFDNDVENENIVNMTNSKTTLIVKKKKSVANRLSKAISKSLSYLRLNKKDKLKEKYN
jgi:hypothetical protein